MIWFRGLGPTTQGIVVMIMAMLVLSGMDAVAKYLMQRNDPMQVVWARYAGHTLFAFIYFAPRLPKLLVTRHLKLQLLRSAFLFLGTYAFFLSLFHLELAEAAAIFDVNPLLITILAAIFLSEKIGGRRIFSVVLGMIGAVIIIRPGMDVFSLYSLLPLLAAFGYAAYVISTRFLGRNENMLTSLLYSTLVGTIVASFLVVPVWQTPSVSDAVLMLVLGALGGTGQFLLIRAFTLAEAAAIAPFSYVGLLFSVVNGFVFFGEFPDFTTLIGALVIVGSGLYVWHRERQLELAI